MPGVLQVLTGKNAGATYSLDREKIRLGRHPDCEVVIDLNSVSRFHANLVLDDGLYYLEDLKSRNGSYVNGRRVEDRIALNDNDRLKICDTLFVYREQGDLSGVSPDVVIEPVDNEATTTVLTAIDAGSSADVMAKVRPEAKLRAVLEISQTIGQELDVDHIYPKILDSLFKIFPQADRALILFCDTEGEFIPKAIKHRRESEDTVRFSRTIVRKAMEQRQAILSADASTDERFALSESIADFRIRSVMCVPLLTQDKSPMGVIQIDTQSNNEKFSQDDLEILASVGAQASIAVENAGLHQEMLKQDRVRRELGFAKEVQAGFLPKSMPQIPGYEFWAFYEAAGQVGGDYYDFVPLPNGNHAVILGDVSGKGVPAALMMAKASSDTKVALLTTSHAIDLAMGILNNSICSASLEDKFITMALCVINSKTHELTIVNAGHMSPMIMRADGAIDEPADETVSGLPIGVLEDYEYESVTTKLAPGETVVIFSDGISEAMNVKNETYGTERIRQKLRTVRLAPEPLGQFLLKDVRAHVAGHQQSDDISLVVFGRS